MKRFVPAAMLLCAMMLRIKGSAQIAIKQSTGTDLTGNTAGVWSGGAGLNGSPSSADTAAWTNNSLGAGLTLGSSASWLGISVTNAVSDTRSSPRGPSLDHPTQQYWI